MQRQLLKYLFLLPLSTLWSGMLKFRHYLYDTQKLNVYTPPLSIPSICVGNLDFGGTGKTPYIEFLIQKKRQEGFKQIAIISRGYGRKSKALLFVKTTHFATQVGDEPLQIKKKFGRKITVVVNANRQKAVEAVLQEKPQTDLIIFDDALQHRKIKASTNILLTTYDNPFWTNALVPLGTLRDVKNRALVAHKMVVTKCPNNLSAKDKTNFLHKIPTAYTHLPTQFMTIQYHTPRHILQNKEQPLSKYDFYLVITGIAQPKSLLYFLDSKNIQFIHLSFPDHHTFTKNDFQQIDKAFKNIKNTNKAILLTEKDYVRIDVPIFDIWAFKLDILYLPITFEGI